MIHGIIAAFFRPGGPYLYMRLVTAGYALSAIGRLIPVKRKQVPGHRPRVPGHRRGTRDRSPPRAAQQGCPSVTREAKSERSAEILPEG